MHYTFFISIYLLFNFLSNSIIPTYHYAWESDKGLTKSVVIKLRKNEIIISSFPSYGGMQFQEKGTFKFDKKTNRINCIIREEYSYSLNTGTNALGDNNCRIIKSFQIMEGNKLREINLDENSKQNDDFEFSQFSRIYDLTEKDKYFRQMEYSIELFKKYRKGERYSK